MSEQAQNLNENEELVEEVQQETTPTEDPLEEAIARVQELEEQLKAQVEETSKKEQDLLLRTRAEIDNMRRRSEQDIEKAHKFALEKFATELLPVLDNLERTIQVADKQNEAVKPLLEGVELTLKSMANSVAKFGVIAIDPQGQSFDPNQHQAMSMVENADVAPNTVIAVMQKGYELNGRVIRPAMVMVSKAPAASVNIEV